MRRRMGETAGGVEVLQGRGTHATTEGEEHIGRRFKMLQHFFTIGNRFFIDKEHGNKVFRIENQVLRLRKTLHFQDLQGDDLYKIREKVARIRDTMEIEKAGQIVAKIHNAMITPLRDRRDISVPGDEDLTAKNTIPDHGYRIFRDEQVSGAIYKRWFTVRDTYGVDVNKSEDALLSLQLL